MYRVNLLPPKLQRESTIDVRRLLILAGATTLIGGFLGACVFFPLNFLLMKNELAFTRQQIADLESVVARVEAMKKERQDLEGAIKEYSATLKERKTWSEIISRLGSITPVDLWLTGLEISNQQSQEGKNEGEAAASKSAGSQPSKDREGGGPPAKPNVMVFKGVSRTLSSVGVFEHNLYQLGYFERVELKKISAGKDGFAFEVTGYLKEEKGR
ncbi:Fimbrial assembly family protein [Desulfofundulus kuznetsovii DSM 6115]|uniref:Fimbrial assembly family protein n=1 Tax=Desulfofundulus kuznetsovii (strain DSM 6115 / VKM B-1805 / 17) TaxID=760568 RepID=A0AAU8PWI9_DESK7|nr:Fimbrial assembly family protein [Desulfofundulus kuznetsovii DSM 6115]